MKLNKNFQTMKIAINLILKIIFLKISFKNFIKKIKEKNWFTYFKKIYKSSIEFSD